jgi:hypothetical protein
MSADSAIFIGRLRFAAHQALEGVVTLELDEARGYHAQAVALHDALAMSLWARVVWRALARNREHAWLHEIVGGNPAPPLASEAE